MGNDQSSTSQREEQKLSQAEVRRLLNEQRKMYEKKCQEVMDQAKVQSPQNAQATNPTPPAFVHPAHAPQPSYTPQPAYAPQPTYAQQPSHFVQNPTLGPSIPGPSFERQRAPYSYGREDLQSAIQGNAPSGPNLYPNLNNRNHTFSFENNNSNPAQDFVFVNGPQRCRPSAPSRDRSVSRSRNNTNDNGLQCPTCKMLFGLQIYQCNRGHSSCNSCKEQGRCCGICGNKISNLRNFALEGYVAEQKMPCLNHNRGCTLSFKLSEMDIHCKECPFKELQCPLKCFWKGQLKELSSHFDALHPEQRSVNINSEIRLRDISRDSQNVYLVLIGSFNFLLHVKVSTSSKVEADRKIYMTVQLIGTKVSASKWSYELHVYNKNESRRKFTFSDAVASHAEPVEELFREGKCSVLPHAYANTFVNNGVFTYKIFIKNNSPRADFGKNQRGRGRN